MRPSPLRHPLAVLRTTIGLTQKDLANLTGRAARTIQAIELGNLPLSEELALRIAQETGVDESWLLAADATIPPQRGAALLAFSREQRAYQRQDYEWQRSFNEATPATQSELAQALRRVPPKEGADLGLTLPQAKAAVQAARPVMLESMDSDLVRLLGTFLNKTLRSPDALLVRWKIRRLVEGLAKERSIALGEGEAGRPPRTKDRRIRQARKTR